MAKPPTLTEREFREFAEGQIKWVTDCLADGTYKVWVPHLVVMTSDHTGKRGIVMSSLMVPFNEDAEKQNAMINVGIQIFKQGVAPLAVCFMSEAWISRQAVDGPRMRPADDPNRQEVISCAAMTCDWQLLRTAAPIIRQNEFIQPISFEPFMAEGVRFPLLEWFWRGFTYAVMKDPQFPQLTGKKVKP